MKNRLVLFLILLLVTTLATNANPVDMRTVCEVAVKFMNANTKVPMRGVNELQLVTTYRTESDDEAFYIFNTPNGFVIVSADDCATPILGYSDEGRFDTDNIPVQLQAYLEGYVEQIQYGIENHIQDEAIALQWALVRSTGRLNENRDGEVVEPLVTALWNQGCYYNAMCPEDENGQCGHCVTGCVATAIGMIMHYWGYPEQGTGSHTYTPMPYPTTQYPEQSANFGETTYDWANMPDRLTDTSTQAEIDAVSTLLWHCGVAVEMNYSPYGSGMEGHFTALMDYFDYSDDMHWEAKQDHESWMSLLKADLDLGHPVFYTGYRWANSGHAFVCDGYDVNDRFHFNWGWSGSSNGYFALDATMIFIYDNDAIFNIHPNAGATHQVHFTTAGNWSTASNWQGGVLPEANDEVFIDVPCQLDQNAEVYALTVSDGQSLTLQSGKTLIVTGDLNNTVTSGLVIEDRAQLVHSVANVQATVRKLITPFNGSGNGWHFIALPFSGSIDVDSVGSLLEDEYDLYGYDESTAYWRNKKGVGSGFTALVATRGYLYANGTAVTLEFSGTLENGSTINVPLSYTYGSALSGFNLVGNPFPCNATLDREYYVLDNNGMDLNPEPIPADTPVPPCTAVFVKAVAVGDRVVFTRVEQ